MDRNLWGLIGVFAVGLVLVGLTFSASAEEEADFTFINGTEPKSLDPQIMTGQPEGRIADAIFEGLTYRDPKTMKPMPGVAESWTISPDGKTYTFKIRKNAKWSDGVAVTAHDFAWSWRRLQDPELGSEYAYIIHMIKYSAEYNLYGGQAERLEGDILKGLDKLLEDLKSEGKSEIEGAAWQKWLGDAHVNDAVAGTPDKDLAALLLRRDEPVTLSLVSAFKEGLKSEAKRRMALHKEAESKFGKSGGVFAKDDHTLVVELNAPTPYFLELTAFYPVYPVPRHVVEIPAEDLPKDAEGKPTGRPWHEDWFLPKKFVGNGPFRLSAWRVNEKIRLTKSDTYWGKDEIKLNVIDALPIENPTTGLNLYLTGNVDWLTNIPPQVLDQLKTREDFHKQPGFIVYYYRFNCTRKPFDDPRVRKAISLAVDRQSVVTNVGRLGQVPAYLLVPPGIPGYEPPTSGLGPDLTEDERIKMAQDLLAEAGYPGGKGIDAIDLLFNTNESHKALAELVADLLERRLGIEIKARNQEWQAYQASTLALEYDIARAGWIGDYLDPNTFLDMWVTNGGNNQTGFTNPQYDQLIRLAKNVSKMLEPGAEKVIDRLKERDRARALYEAFRDEEDSDAKRVAGEKLRMHLFREAEAILFQDEFPIIPIYFYVTSNMVKPHVRGWYSELELDDGRKIPNLQDIHPLRSIWIDRSATGGR